MAKKKGKAVKSVDPERSAAMKGNQNASKGGPQNRLVEFKTGGFLGMGGKTHYTTGHQDNHGATTFAGNGLPGNAHSIKIFGVYKPATTKKSTRAKKK